MHSIIFEHPLNEKMRMMLRVETLTKQLKLFGDINNLNEAIPFFKALCDLLYLTERIDLRTEFLKELDKQQYKLTTWLKNPEIDKHELQQTLNHTQQLIEQLTKLNLRIGHQIRHDPLIQIIKQRINIPYGYCNFDLPQLHIWLSFTAEQRSVDIARWMNNLSPLEDCITLILKLIRNSAKFVTFEYRSNFYQETKENFELLRIRLNSQVQVYPQISGNRSRFMIRLVNYNDQTTSHLSFPFELSCC